MFYELLYIVPNNYSDDEVEGISKKISSLGEKEGFKIIKEENLGKKKLAYEIKKVYYGYYLVVQFTIEEKDNLLKFSKKLAIMQEVLRHQIVKYKKFPEKISASQIKTSLDRGNRSDKKFVAAHEDKYEERKEEIAPREVKDQKSEEIQKEDKKIDMQELDKKIDELLENVDA
ncbi:MAG: 30S ribosomal protein S6 [bacterium]